MKKFEPVIPGFPHMIHGADYNPDQWIKYDPDIISKDMALMRAANMNSLSVGIFAWASLEPSEGVYDFSWLDEAMDGIANNGGRAVLATPSGARPRWMAQKYPEVLRVARDGRRNLFGERHNHCYSSPVYREKVRAMNEQLALRYKDHPALGIWHISNELSGECFCPLCVAAFREWLKEKYGTLERLNYEYWGGFWAHSYTDWEQIDPPMPNGDTTVNALNLDWKRFCTHQTIEFFKVEIEPLRRITPNIPITTNYMEYFFGVDYRELSRYIDVASWDDYPFWSDTDADADMALNRALWHDVIRSMKHRPFMLMESTPSVVNWKQVDKLKRPGMHRLHSMLALAHGSDSVQYFQFRKSRNSMEQHHGAVVDHVGHGDTRVFRDVASLGADLKKLDSIVGTDTESKVAMLLDWGNKWALDDAWYFQRTDKKLFPTMLSHYKPFARRGVNVDVIGYDDDFSAYPLLILPMAYSMPEALIDKLERYVAAGGTVVATYTAGMVNENALTYLGGWPAGKLKDVFGVWNEEISCLLPGETNSVSVGGKSYTAIDYCELIHPRGAETLGVYEQDFFAGMSAVCKNSYGAGSAYYLAFRDDGSFVDDLYAQLIDELAIASPFGVLPEGVTATVRTDGDRDYIFLMNFSHSAKAVANDKELINVETGERVAGAIELKPTSVVILARER